MKLRLRSPAKTALLLLVLSPSPVNVVAKHEHGRRPRAIKRFEKSPYRQQPQTSQDIALGNPLRQDVDEDAGGLKLEKAEAITPITVERGCPYAIDSEEEAISRMKNASLPGNVLKVEHLTFCRTGNHFTSFFRNLALGYCCKSKMVWLPPKDDVLAPGLFNEGTHGPRWFDFTSAPDMPGFNSSTCTTDITWAGQRAFHMHQLETPDHEYHVPGLKECITRAPRLLGCEAAYYFPKDVDVCGTAAAPPTSPPVDQDEEMRLDPGERRDELERRKIAEAKSTPVNEEESGQAQGQREGSGPEAEGGGGEGTLVLHVRSGDIFDNDVLAYYGQPPLQFYLQVMQHADWDRVDIVTNAQDEDNLNPVIPALQAKLSAGELPATVNIHTNRTMEEDLRSMMCADGLALARSTLVSLTGFHSKAKRIYGPIQCNNQLNHIALHRPEVQMYGLVWPGHYGVYKNWENTYDQRQEMLAYDGIDGFSKCSSDER